MNVRRSLRNLPVVLLLSGVAMIGMATPALAHAELVASTPAEGAKLAAAPKQVKLTFNEPVTPAADPLTVTGPGAEWTIGKPSSAGAVITVPVQASGPAGRYTLTYRVVSGDGDAVTGTVAFTLTAAAAPATSTTTAAPATTTADPPSTVDSAGAGDASGGDSADRADSDGGVPVLVWIIGAAVVLVAGAVVALRAGRGRRS